MPQLKRRLAPAAVLLLLATSVPVPAQSPRPSDPELAAGIALVREGDFENAVLKLDTVVRRLLAAPGTQKDAALAYVYLGVAFLELNQEPVARAKFQLAQALDAQMRLDPRQFSPEQIRVFESARAETAARPSPPPATREPQKKKKSTLPWILGGAAVVGGGVAVAAGGGGGGGGATTTIPVGNTTTTTQPPPPSPSPSATPTPAPTPTPTPTPAPSPTCTYSLTGPSINPFPLTGGVGTCGVQATSGCAWVAESTESWIQLTPPDSGTGSGPIAFTVSANAGSAQRTGRIQLRGTAVACEVRQNGTGLP